MRLLGCLFTLGWIGSAQAMQRSVTLGGLCARSDRVVVGEVTGLESIVRDDGSGRIETWADVSVVQTLRGAPSEDLRLVVPGGAVAGMRMWVEDAPRLQTDSRYLFLLVDLPGRDAVAVLGGEAGARPIQRGAVITLADLEGCHAP